MPQLYLVNALRDGGKGGKMIDKTYNKYKQALDEIEQVISNFPAEGVQEIPQTQMEYTQYFLSINEAKLQKTLRIIYEAKKEKGKMNKQELQDEINKTKEHLANMEKMLAECEYERWKPEKGKMFYFLNSYNNAISETWDADSSDAGHYNIYNCFKTREQAEVEAEKILVRRMLENIARRLNKGEKIDWNNVYQVKYSINLNFLLDKISVFGYFQNKGQGGVYCLDKSFQDVAIQEIGEERLKKYLRSE